MSTGPSEWAEWLGDELQGLHELAEKVRRDEASLADLLTELDEGERLASEYDAWATDE